MSEESEVNNMGGGIITRLDTAHGFVAASFGVE